MSGPGTHFARQIRPAAAPGGSQTEILAELRRVITSGVAMPGTIIRIDEVAAALGVSTIPVREVLKTLIAEGLVSHNGRRGYQVIQLTSAEYAEINLLFGALERVALPVSLQRATEHDHESLRALVGRQREGLEQFGTLAWQQITREIHLAFLQPSGMRRLVSTYINLWAQIDVGMPWRASSPEQRRTMLCAHESMLEAFVARDPAMLHRAIELHDSALAVTVGELASELAARSFFRPE